MLMANTIEPFAGELRRAVDALEEALAIPNLPESRAVIAARNESRDAAAAVERARAESAEAYKGEPRTRTIAGEWAPGPKASAASKALAAAERRLEKAHADFRLAEKREQDAFLAAILKTTAAAAPTFSELVALLHDGFDPLIALHRHAARRGLPITRLLRAAAAIDEPLRTIVAAMNTATASDKG